MPDFERATRDLELFISKDDPVRLAYVKGLHKGLDNARIQIAFMAGVIAVTVVFVRVVCL